MSCVGFVKVVLAELFDEFLHQVMAADIGQSRPMFVLGA